MRDGLSGEWALAADTPQPLAWSEGLNLQSIKQALDILATGLLSGAFLFALWGGYHKRWVWGWQYREVVDDRDRYRTLLFEKIAQLEAVQQAALRRQLKGDT